MNPWLLLAPPAAVALLLAAFVLGYWRGTGAGYRDGYKDGQVDLEEAMADEEESVAALSRTLRCSPEDLPAVFRAAFNRRDRSAQSDALPDLRNARRREVN